MDETQLVIPKFSSFETDSQPVVFKAVKPLTIKNLLADGRLPLESSTMSSRTHRTWEHSKWWLEPCGGIHTLNVTSYDEPRWLRYLLRDGWPCFVVWDKGAEGRDILPSKEAPLNFAAYSRLPVFNDNGAQDGYRWLTAKASLWLSGDKWPDVYCVAECREQRIPTELRLHHSLSAHSGSEYLLSIARQKFNEFCSDTLGDAEDNWRFSFLPQHQRYRQDVEFAAWCRVVSWQEAFAAAKEPWQLAVTIREHSARLKAGARATTIVAAQAAAKSRGAEAQKLLSWIDEYVIHFEGFPLI